MQFPLLASIPLRENKGGSVRALTDLEGNITDTFSYDAYGNLLQPSSLFLPTSYLYRGERYDADLGQYYLRARFYNSDLGRFHTLDEYEGRTGEPLSLHKYLYAHGNPVSGSDPSGRMFLAEAMVSNSLFQSLVDMGRTGWAGNPLGRVRFAYVNTHDPDQTTKDFETGDRYKKGVKYQVMGIDKRVEAYKEELKKSSKNRSSHARIDTIEFVHITNWDEFDLFLNSSWHPSIGFDIIFAHASIGGSINAHANIGGYVNVFGEAFAPENSGYRNGTFRKKGSWAEWVGQYATDVDSFKVSTSAVIWSCAYGRVEFDEATSNFGGHIKRILRI